MAHTKSAEKRLRQGNKARLRNKSVKTHLKTRDKKFQAAVAEGNAEEAGKQALLLQKSLDRAVTHGVIHPNKASRKKSGTAVKLNKLKAQKSGA